MYVRNVPLCELWFRLTLLVVELKGQTKREGFTLFCLDAERLGWIDRRVLYFECLRSGKVDDVWEGVDPFTKTVP